MASRIQGLLFALILLVPVIEGSAQLPFSILLEARGGLAMPAGEFAGEGSDFSAESGPVLGGSVAIFPTSSVGVFVGYQQSRFACDRCEATGLDGTAVANGPEAGIHLALPIGTSGLAGWVRGGIVQQILSFSGFDDEMSSEPEIGFTGGVGASIPVLQFVEIVPALRYMSFPAEFEFTAFSPRSIQVSAISLDLGVGLRF